MQFIQKWLYYYYFYYVNEINMKLTFNKQQWEYSPKMTVSEFTEANEYNICVAYQEEFPQYAYKINDGDTDHMRDWVQQNENLYKEIMCELYADCLWVDTLTVWTKSVVTEKMHRQAVEYMLDPDNAYDIWRDEQLMEAQHAKYEEYATE